MPHAIRELLRHLSNASVAAVVSLTITVSVTHDVPLARAQSSDDPPSTEQLQHMLEQRDVVIGDLLRRVEELERRLSEGEGSQPSGTAAVAEEASEPPEQVAVRAAVHAGFARLVFAWPQAIRVDSKYEADRLVLRFERAMTADLSGAAAVLSEYLTGLEKGRHMSEVVLRLAPDVAATVDNDADSTVIVDLTRAPAGDLRPVVLRTGIHDGGYARLVFDWAVPVAFQTRRNDRWLWITFDRVGAFDTRVLVAELHLWIEAAETDVRDGRSEVRLTLKSMTDARTFPVEDSKVVIDLYHLQVPVQTDAPSPQDPEPADAERAVTEPSSPPSSTETAPGQLPVEEEEVERALERALTQTGALLLPLGQVEIEPAFSYTRREVAAPTQLSQGNTTLVAQDRVRRNEYTSGLGLRFGLPLNAQLDLDLPYQVVEQSTTTEVGFDPQREVDDSGAGLGDLGVALAKTLLREDRWWPDLVARVRWDSATGKLQDDGVVLGSGFNELDFSLTATRSQDPLAFVTGVDYRTTFENNDLEPGDELGFVVGAFLAASPETALRPVLDQRFVDDLRFDGEGINGTDLVIGTLDLGAAVILGHGTLLDVAAGVGLI